jgi:hypothetical protein
LPRCPEECERPAEGCADTYIDSYIEGARSGGESGEMRACRAGPDESVLPEEESVLSEPQRC